MMKNSRLLAGILIIALTVLAFTYYLSRHSYLISQLKQTSPFTIMWLLLLYSGWFAALALSVQATVRLCRKTLGTKDSLMLNAYSTLVNFFVPGQSGPIVRGAYLKKRRQLRVRDYIFSVAVYYAMYALVSVFLLLAGSRPWWQTLLALVAVGGLSASIIKLYAKRSKASIKYFNFSPANLSFLLLATILQAIIQTAIYAVELHDVNARIGLHQVMSYTGAANFALFVALTPGAIGIRESFLLLSQHLHHISSANIVSASIIDRSVFLLFLAILFVLTIILHAKDKLRIKLSEKTATI